jgi:hypothetical protein
MSVLQAATRLMSARTNQQARAGRVQENPRYRRGESVIALVRFFRANGSWPRSAEYEDWARIMRHAARVCGAPHPRLPGRHKIIQDFGSFDRALEAAKSIYAGDREQGGN